MGTVLLHARHFTSREWWRGRAEAAAARQAEAAVERRIGASREYLLSLKGKYGGRRGFVIGNGPSLRLADLERLKDEVTLAANKVHLAFDRVSWRPTHLTIVDPLVWEKVQPEIWDHHERVLVPSYLPDHGRGRAVTFRYLGNAAEKGAGSGDFLFSPDLCAGAYGGYTVTFENLQLAVHLGLNPIYLVGCDHFYSGESQITPNTPIAAASAANHFVANYRAVGEVVNPAPVSEMNESFRQARRYAEAHGLRIVNATRGGHLEIFEREELDAILR